MTIALKVLFVSVKIVGLVLMFALTVVLGTIFAFNKMSR